MRQWLARAKGIEGWFAASLGDDAFDFARGRYVPAATPRISSYGSQRVARDKNPLQKIANDLQLERSQCAALLQPGEYQLLLVEAPNVPANELKSAIRWRVKDMLDYPVDEATFDLLDIPVDDAGTSRAHMMYAVCARNDLIEKRMRTFRDARIPLSVIDIRETAQRNVAALFEEPERGLAVAYFADTWGMLTINFHGELYFARRTDTGLKQLVVTDPEARKDAFERAALELQRTFDHFDRQFHHVPVARLLVAPMPEDIGLVPFLGANLTIPVHSMDLLDKLSFEAGPPDVATQWRLFHHFGASLRHEGKAS
jgi:MSHA biogenesis protein MshI